MSKKVVREVNGQWIEDIQMNTQESADHIDSTVGTLEVWRSIGRHPHLKSFKEKDGRVYYWKSNLDYHLDLPLMKSRA
ncbi:hypothetical protein FAM09_07090 [Niastella caeni]|uniref:Uncharacterized protein n=1 Tax=Niastella caeni TaxID=2569763 RepID=A0A4S8I119_9BACT|nr:hypothetical protein [Niastella caeni]THU41858.1 hypothetical protein FAM09_07090 [Niastella caeni]